MPLRLHLIPGSTTSRWLKSERVAKVQKVTIRQMLSWIFLASRQRKKGCALKNVFVSKDFSGEYSLPFLSSTINLRYIATRAKIELLPENH